MKLCENLSRTKVNRIHEGKKRTLFRETKGTKASNKENEGDTCQKQQCNLLWRTVWQFLFSRIVELILKRKV